MAFEFIHWWWFFKAVKGKRQCDTLGNFTGSQVLWDPSLYPWYALALAVPSALTVTTCSCSCTMAPHFYQRDNDRALPWPGSDQGVSSSHKILFFSFFFLSKAAGFVYFVFQVGWVLDLVCSTTQRHVSLNERWGVDDSVSALWSQSFLLVLL